jgi:hypothetical protein
MLQLCWVLVVMTYVQPLAPVQPLGTCGTMLHYKPCYSQVECYVATSALGSRSGSDDRFDDTWLLGSGRCSRGAGTSRAYTAAWMQERDVPHPSGAQHVSSMTYL